MRAKDRAEDERPLRAAEQQVLEAARRQYRQGSGPVAGPGEGLLRLRREGRGPRRREVAQGGAAAQPRRACRVGRHPAVPCDRPGSLRARNDVATVRRSAARCVADAGGRRRRDGDRRGQDARRCDRRGRIRDRRPQRARHLGQRLPGPTRRRVDGPAAGGDGSDGRLDHRRVHRGRAARGLRLRRHLRLGQRDRLRRAARSARHRRRGPGVPGPRRRAHRRGRLRARRRGAGPAGARGHHSPGDAAAGDHPDGRRARLRQGLRHRRRPPQRPPHRRRVRASSRRSSGSTSTPRRTSAPH